MNKFKIDSYQLVETQKWAPCGMLFEFEDGKINIQEVDFPPEYRFDTQEEADNFFRKHYLGEGYTEELS